MSRKCDTHLWGGGDGCMKCLALTNKDILDEQRRRDRDADERDRRDRKEREKQRERDQIARREAERLRYEEDDEPVRSREAETASREFSEWSAAQDAAMARKVAKYGPRPADLPEGVPTMTEQGQKVVNVLRLVLGAVTGVLTVWIGISMSLPTDRYSLGSWFATAVVAFLTGAALAMPPLRGWSAWILRAGIAAEGLFLLQPWHMEGGTVVLTLIAGALGVWLGCIPVAIVVGVTESQAPSDDAIRVRDLQRDWDQAGGGQ